MKIFDKNFLGITGDSIFYLINNTGTQDDIIGNGDDSTNYLDVTRPCSGNQPYNNRQPTIYIPYFIFVI